jgi:hypothetical protein
MQHIIATTDHHLKTITFQTPGSPRVALVGCAAQQHPAHVAVDVVPSGSLLGDSKTLATISQAQD